MLCALSEPGFIPWSRRRPKTEALESKHINAVGQKGAVSIKCLGAFQQLNNNHFSNKTHKHNYSLM